MEEALKDQLERSECLGGHVKRDEFSWRFRLFGKSPMVFRAHGSFIWPGGAFRDQAVDQEKGTRGFGNMS